MAGNTVVVSVLAETSKFKKGMEELGNFAKLAVGAMAIVGGAVATIGLANYVVEAAAASDATDKFKQTLNFAKISPDKIDALTASTRKYADQTVYSLSDIQNITAQLAANGVEGYGVLAESLGNVNAVAGGTTETYKRVGSVVTQTAAAGKLNTENWKQFAEAIPGASGIIREQMRKNGAYTGNFNDALAKGQIDANEYFTALRQVGMTDVAKDAATSTKTFEGAWGNLQAALVGGIGDILNVVKPFATEFLSSTADAVGPILASLKDTLQNQVMPALQAFGDWFNNTGKPAIEGFFTFLNDNKDVLGVLGAAVAGIAGVWAIWTGAIAVWNGIIGIATAAQALFNLVMAANPIMLVVMAIAALVAGLVYFFTQTEVGRAAWKTFTDFLANSWKGFSEFIVNSWKGVVAFFTGIPGTIKGIFSGALSWLTSAGKNAMDGLKNGVTSAWNNVASWFRSVPGLITGAIGNAGAILSNAGRAIMEGFLNGLRESWKGVTDFVGGIADWIRANKGPLPYDYKLLQPAGKAIMGGFGDSLAAGFSNVKSMVSGFAPALSGVFDGVGGDLSMAAASGTGNTFYSFDGISFSSANAEEASVLDEFAQFLRRKARAA